MLSHAGYTETRDDHVSKQNEISINETENALKRIHLNPFYRQYESTVNGFSSTTTNPFLTQSKDSDESTTSRDNNKDLLRHRQSNGWSHFPTSTSSPENDPAIFPPSTLNQETNQTTFPNQTGDIFQNSYSTRTSLTGLSKQKTNIFEPSRGENNVSEKMVANEEIANEKDYLLEYILANQKNDVEPTHITTESHQPDFFLTSPEISDDIFTNTAASQSCDIFHTPEGGVQSRGLQNLFQTSKSVQSNNSHLSDNSAVKNGQFTLQNSHFDKNQPTELNNGLFQDPSPLNASANGGQMFRRRPPKPIPRRKSTKNPIQSINHDHFSTSAVSVPADQKPAQTLFTPNFTSISTPPVPQPRSNIQDTKLTEDVHKSQVYEDVLYIGQEKCVEDWPEDSPELSPDWKPVGKLKLRRESLRITQAEAALNGDSYGKKSGKIKKRMSISRRGSKIKSRDDLTFPQTDTVFIESQEKYSDSLNGAYGDTLPWGTKLHGSDDILPEVEEEVVQNAKMKSKSLKTKKTKFIVPHVQYRGSKKNSFDENGSPFPQAYKSDVIRESYEDTLRNSEQKEPTRTKDCRPKESTKFKHFSSPQLTKDPVDDDLKMKNGFSFSKESKENVSLRAENENHCLPDDIFYQNDELSLKTSDKSEKKQKVQDSRPKKSHTFIVPYQSRKESKNGLQSPLEKDIPEKGADLFKASDIKAMEIYASEDYNQMRESPVQRISPIIQRDSKSLNDAGKGADLFKAGDIPDDDWTDKHTMDSKTEKLKTPRLISRESKSEDHVFFAEDIEPPGATSGDYYLSEAAKAEWMSSQMDLRRTKEADEDEEEEEGDTDSLMEWWSTVELWDELPSDEQMSKMEDETKSFTEIADKVHRGLRVFYKVFIEQAEFLYQNVLRLYAIGDNISNFHRRAKIANITGGTTTAVGGVAAIAGLALAPVTFGASLIVSAIGLGVATAGGITAASASISDNVHDMNDRKKIEMVVQDFEDRLLELRRCLSFVAEGVRRLRFHPLLRRNNYYAGDWEVRRALQTISLVGEPVDQAEDIVEKSTKALNSVCKGMDNYFSKDSKEVKKGCKKEVTTKVNMLAKLLHDALMELNSIREQLMEATGYV